MKIDFFTITISLIICSLLSSCSEDSNNNESFSQSSLIGTWKVVAGDLNQQDEKYIYVVTFKEDNTFSYDYYTDTNGYGIYIYRGTVNDEYSLNPDNGFCNIGHKASATFFNFTLVSCNPDNIIVDSWAGEKLVFEKYIQNDPKNSLYGYWEYTNASGETVKADGSVWSINSFGKWDYLYFSEGGIIGQPTYNGITFKRDKAEMMIFNVTNDQVLLSKDNSVDNIYDTYNIKKITENELILNYNGPDISEEGAYLNVDIKHIRIKTIEE